MPLNIGAITKITVTGTAAAGALPGNSGVYLITTNTDCYVRFDGDTATASAYDIFMPKGSAFVVQPVTKGDFSFIREAVSGVASISEIN